MAKADCTVPAAELALFEAREAKRPFDRALACVSEPTTRPQPARS